jgi:hypothetical protein
VNIVDIEIDGCGLRFESDCRAAVDELGRVLADVFASPYYECTIGRAPLNPDAPTLRYVDGPGYDVDFQPDRNVITVTAPWTEVSNSTLVGMWLFYLSELVRQRRGEYILHASAVIHNGRAVVVSGAGESGKTTLALHLCLSHGFELYANNKVKVGLLDGRPCVLRGDPVFNFRISSLRQYSPAICESIFSAAPNSQPPWRRKQRVAPPSLGIKTASGPAVIGTFLLVSLDAEALAADVRTVCEGDTSHDGFWAQAKLYDEMSSLVRGTRFVPLVGSAGFRDFCVPSLDTAEYVHRRLAFLRELFRTARVMIVRGTLAACEEVVLEHLERLPVHSVAQGTRQT